MSPCRYSLPYSYAFLRHITFSPDPSFFPPFLDIQSQTCPLRRRSFVQGPLDFWSIFFSSLLASRSRPSCPASFCDVPSLVFVTKASDFLNSLISYLPNPTPSIAASRPPYRSFLFLDSFFSSRSSTAAFSHASSHFFPVHSLPPIDQRIVVTLSESCFAPFFPSPVETKVLLYL